MEVLSSDPEANMEVLSLIFFFFFFFFVYKTLCHIDKGYM